MKSSGKFVRSIVIGAMLVTGFILIWLLVLFFPPQQTIQDRLQIFPRERDLIITAYNDTTDYSGMSTCSLLAVTSNAVVYSYKLRKHPVTQRNPYAGIFIERKFAGGEGNSFIDISEYDSVYISIGTNKNNDGWFKLHLKSFIPGKTKYGDFRTYYHSEKEVGLDSVQSLYAISLKDFRIHEETKKFLKSTDLPNHLPPDFTKLFGFNVQTGTGQIIDSENREGTNTITEIGFVKNRHELNQINIIIIILGLISYVFIILRNLSRKDQIGKTQKKLFTPAEKWRNAIRMIENDLNTSLLKVAISVGYNNPDPNNISTQFSRDFRKELGISPNYYKCYVLTKQILNEEPETRLEDLPKKLNDGLSLNKPLRNLDHLRDVFKDLKTEPKELDEYAQEKIKNAFKFFPLFKWWRGFFLLLSLWN